MSQPVRIFAESTTKGYLPIKCDDDGNLVIQLEGSTVNVGDVDVVNLVAAANASTPYIVVCGKQADGTITPLRCDADGQILIEGT